MKTYMQLLAECAKEITELFPWDIENKLNEFKLIIDVREPYEFSAMHMQNSINIPRGILESSCVWDYEETVPELVTAYDEKILLVCRSGHRSILAAHTMKQLGYKHAISLRTGLRGWFEFEQILVDNDGQIIDEDTADKFFTPQVRDEQLKPK